MGYTVAMAQESSTELVKAAEASKALDVPVHVLYRLVARKKIPYVDVTQKWHERKQYRFNVDAVRTALEGGTRQAS